MAKVEQRNCLKSPDKYRTSILSSAENGSTGLYLGVSRYRRPTIEASPTTFQTVSEDEFRKFGRRKEGRVDPRTRGHATAKTVCGAVVVGCKGSVGSGVFAVVIADIALTLSREIRKENELCPLKICGRAR